MVFKNQCYWDKIHIPYIDRFRVYNLIVSDIFTELCDHYPKSILEYSHRIPFLPEIAISSHSSIHSNPLGLGQLLFSFLSPWMCWLWTFHRLEPNFHVVSDCVGLFPLDSWCLAESLACGWPSRNIRWMTSWLKNWKFRHSQSQSLPFLAICYILTRIDCCFVFVFVFV